MSPSASGIYHCDIAVHDDVDPSVRETVYVGLYASGGNELIRCYNSKPLSLIYNHVTINHVQCYVSHVAYINMRWP